MQDVSKGGRTVLFVSHNMNAVESLCSSVIYLSRGQLVADTKDVRGTIGKYLNVGVDKTQSGEWRNPGSMLKNPWFFPTKFYIGDATGQPVALPVRNDGNLYIYIEGKVETEDIALNVGYGLYDESETLLYWSAATDLPEDQWPKMRKGWNRLKSPFPARLLNQGTYKLDLLIALYHRQWISCPGDGAPRIQLAIQGGLSDSPYWVERRPGLLAPVNNWTAEAI